MYELGVLQKLGFQNIYLSKDCEKARVDNVYEWVRAHGIALENQEVWRVSTSWTDWWKLSKVVRARTSLLLCLHCALQHFWPQHQLMWTRQPFILGSCFSLVLYGCTVNWKWSFRLYNGFLNPSFECYCIHISCQLNQYTLWACR